MVALSYPTLIYQAWASGGGAAQGTLNTLGTISGGVLVSPSNSPTGASLADGFPIIEMTNPNAGGTGPNGGDVNGIFNYLTAFQAWVNAGGQFKFNATLAAAIGGYPIGTVLQLNTGLGSVVSTVANNTQDPNAAMTGWAPWAGPAFAVSQAATAFNTTGTAPAFVLTPTPALTALATNDCYNVTFSAAGTTGSNTLNVSGTGAKNLMQYDLNGNLVPAVITSGLTAACQYNGTYWVVLDALPSSTISSTQQTLVANEGAAGATIPVFKSGVIAAVKSMITNNFNGTNTVSFIQSYLTSWMGATTLPANFFVVGKTLKVTFFLNTVCTTGGTLLFNFFLGGNNYLSLAAPASVASWMWKLEIYLTCQAPGAAGTANFNMVAVVTGATTTTALFITPLYSLVKISGTLSTIVANALDITVAAGGCVTSSAGVSNSVIEVLG